jgi:hypothetical protein
MPPPAPYSQVDLFQVVKQNFRFPSNKLDYISQSLDLGEKLHHTGHQLWRDCLDGKEAAWKLMRKYNRQDVVLTEDLYRRLLPWIKNHPHHGLYVDISADLCPNCGSQDLVRQGYARTTVGRFQRLQCRGCGTWSRSSTRLGGVATTQVK